MSLSGVNRETIEQIISSEAESKLNRPKKRKHVSLDETDMFAEARNSEFKHAMKSYRSENTSVKKLKLVDEINEIRSKHHDVKKLIERPEPRASMSIPVLKHELDVAMRLVKGRFGITMGRSFIAYAAMLTETMVIPAINDRTGRNIDATGFGLTVSKNIEVFDEGLEAFVDKYDFIFNINPAWMIPITFIGILGETVKRNEMRRGELFTNSNSGNKNAASTSSS